MLYDFEPEVVLPADQFPAALMFLAVLAYPKRGDGQPGRPGARFAAALQNHALWCARKVKGLRQLRMEIGDPTYQPPQRAQFRGTLSRGLRRLDRRIACHSLQMTRTFNAFFAVRTAGARAMAEGRRDEFFLFTKDGQIGVPRPVEWERAYRSPAQTIARDLERWENRLGLNDTTGKANPTQKARDLVKRAIRESNPVLHMVHAIDSAAREIGPTIGGWGRRNPYLALLMNAEMWIDKAIEEAERWRLMSIAPLVPDLNPDAMIRLVREGSC